MVRNFKGGKKSKGMGRKHVSSGNMQKKIRVVEEEGEIYAGVTKMLGNAMVEVLCLDGRKCICQIRQKFRGRNRRDNNIDIASWVLVGLREWETVVEGKLPICDLIAVYNPNDIENLKKMDIDWSPFGAIEDKNGIKMIEESNDVMFIENIMSSNAEQDPDPTNETMVDTIFDDINDTEIDIEEI